jgi:MFS family permease
MAFSMFIFGFQSSTVEVLHMSATGISLLFSLFGVLGLISQLVLLQQFIKIFKVKKALLFALIWVAVVFAVMFFAKSIIPFVAASIALGLVNNFVQPITQTILSEETSETEQGEMQGLNASYMSIGQIVGPIIAGAMATLSISAPFLGASALTILCVYLAIKIFSHKELKLV